MSLASVLLEFDVEVLPVQTRIRKPRQTHAGKTLERIYTKHGEGHLRFVLSSILETENNAMALEASVIEAVSYTVIHHPQWAERAGDWLNAFDRIDLVNCLALAKASKVRPTKDGVAQNIYLFLMDDMETERQKELFG